jgi:hypothetical protein
VRIALGSDKENPVQLHPHDWHVTSQAMSSWNQGHVRGGHMGNGFWAVEVIRPGTYDIELRRWPRHLDQPIEATHARLEIGSTDVDQPIPASATKSTFRVRLEPGKTRMQTWLTTPEGKTRGAYFAYVTFVE